VSGVGRVPAGPVLTTHRRLGLGPVIRRGGSTAYRQVVVTDGEPHLVRDELAAGAGGVLTPTAGRPLLCLVHVTDLQLADVSSPARFEFLNRYFADSRYSRIVPVQRPQEALTAHAVDATVRTMSNLSGPATGLLPDMAVTTGDSIDNAQWNELQAFLALFEGGTVTFGGSYAGVQVQHWPDDIFWKPDGEGPDGPDIFRREFGFPHHPGLLERAVGDFAATGLSMGWLSCFGNHEALNQGVGVQTEALAAALTGGLKPVALPDDFDHDRALEIFTERAEHLMTGLARPVPAVAERKPITRGDFVAAHFGPGARPCGHGFTERNLRDGTAYYVHDTPTVRLIALDTTCLAGGADGCLDLDQARWLETSLAEVHSVYRGADGRWIGSGNADKLVILFSHHGIDTLTNTRLAHRGPAGVPLLTGEEVLGLLHRFGNVVLWLNGHTHTNAIRPRPDPDAPGRGFWEVTTCAVVDWPCQTRLVELIDSGDELTIVCTMVDHDAPPAVSAVLTGDDMASLHRELAANMPFLGADSGRDGVAGDRNVVLRVPAPFRLATLSA